MNIEFLGPDKLKVDLSCIDLDRYDLDYLSISSNSPGTRRMLKDILSEAEESTGFSTKNCKLLIEVLPGRSDGCVLYLTKLPAGESRGRRAETAAGKTGSYILSCRSVDDAINAINCFAGYPDIPLKKSSLYTMDGKYLLSFSPARFGVDGNRLDALLSTLSEYGETGASSPVREAILAEHGYTVSDGRAVESFMRYFH